MLKVQQFHEITTTFQYYESTVQFYISNWISSSQIHLIESENENRSKPNKNL